jgi:hypothetical protein
VLATGCCHLISTPAIVGPTCKHADQAYSEFIPSLLEIIEKGHAKFPVALRPKQSGSANCSAAHLIS